jgi:hypothetical protein
MISRCMGKEEEEDTGELVGDIYRKIAIHVGTQLPARIDVSVKQQLGQ